MYAERTSFGTFAQFSPLEFQFVNGNFAAFLRSSINSMKQAEQTIKAIQCKISSRLIQRFLSYDVVQHKTHLYSIISKTVKL
jgi:hypothetical protein